MAERMLELDDFKDHIGTVYSLDLADLPSLSLTLDEATPLTPPARAGFRLPFSLLFIGPSEPILPQRIYLLRHQAMGALTIFLVPIAKDPRGVTYQAIFN